MRYRYVLLLVCCCYHFTLNAQRYIWAPDSIAKDNPNYAMDRYRDVLRYHNPFMYLAYPVVKPLGKRRLPLKEGEGKDGYWLEGNFAYRFSIYNGR